MFNSKTGQQQWSRINEDGELIFFENVKDPKYNPELEKYTDYRFTTQQKINTIADEMSNDVEYTYQNFASVFNDIGSGVQNGAKVLRYLPFIALATGGYILLKKSKAI